MKTYIVFILFLGMFLIMNGIYQQKLRNITKLVRTEYRFVPRTLYDEVLSTGDGNVQTTFKNMFNSPDPWPRGV